MRPLALGLRVALLGVFLSLIVAACNGGPSGTTTSSATAVPASTLAFAPAAAAPTALPQGRAGRFRCRRSPAFRASAARTATTLPVNASGAVTAVVTLSSSGSFGTSGRTSGAEIYGSPWRNGHQRHAGDAAVCGRRHQHRQHADASQFLELDARHAESCRRELPSGSHITIRRCRRTAGTSIARSARIR